MSGIRLFDKLHVRPTVTIVLLFFDSFADDHTRVQLVELDGYPGSDYINANFIDVSTTTTKIATVTICLNLYSFISFIDRYLIFPLEIIAKSKLQAMRIKEMIANYRSS